MEPKLQSRYQSVRNCTYWPVLGKFNDWSILSFSTKATTQEDTDKIFHVVLDGISENMEESAKIDKCGAINTIYNSTMGSYVVKFMSEA